MRNSAAMKKLSLGATSGGRTPACTRALATHPAEATTIAASGMRIAIIAMTALRLSSTERAESRRITMPWLRK